LAERLTFASEEVCRQSVSGQIKLVTNYVILGPWGGQAEGESLATVVAMASAAMNLHMRGQ
jgi:hypothetical protein